MGNKQSGHKKNDACLFSQLFALKSDELANRNGYDHFADMCGNLWMGIAPKVQIFKVCHYHININHTHHPCFTTHTTFKDEISEALLCSERNKIELL